MSGLQFTTRPGRYIPALPLLRSPPGPLQGYRRHPRRRRDPTNTGTLRRAFRATAKLRLRKIRALLRTAIVDHDILGLGSEHINFAAPAARLSSFNSWFEAMTKLELASGWSYDWIKKAVASGEREARKELDAQRTFERATVEYLCEWAQTELAGIAAALTQQVTRAAADITGSHGKVRPAPAFRLLAAPFAKLSKQRLHPFAHDAIVRSHVKAKFAVYRANQVLLVGVKAETNPRRKQRIKDDFDESLPPARTRQVRQQGRRSYTDRQARVSFGNSPAQRTRRT